VLNNWIKLPYKVVSHKAAVRPATLERRPFAGFHPVHSNIGILNGMGTKGTSLAPFFANQLVQRLVYDFPIAPEADVQRFSRILQKG
jgi:glycine/D-amino acid oxidase-like deaminating enzyme